jgi:leucyl-tRNA synthetase
VWIADYVLMGYGTGAIMAVPGHDARDFAFARTFDLPVVPVVLPPDEWLREQASALGLDGSDVIVIRQRYLADPTLLAEVFAGDGVAVNSASERVSLDGTSTAEAKAHIVAWLEAAGLGRGEVQYKLRDWLFSRQRYWGEPFPILHDAEGVVHGVPDDRLPVELPDLDDFRPVASDDINAPPEPSLGRADASWKLVEIDGVRYRRELNTMPQWAGSCWYYLRYLDPTNQERFVDPEVERYWMQPNGLDLYMGGAEHAVLHLLYARFWHKVLFDLGHVSTVEPFGRLFNQGYIQAYSYQDPRGIYVDADRVEEGAAGTFTFEGEPVSRFLGKMGKSLKNSVSPDEIIEEYGCDTLRLYEMYLGPLEASKPWNTRAIVGSYRFVARLWRNLIDEDTGSLRVTDEPPSDDLLRLTHKTIAGVSDNMDGLRFNSAIARLIELNNALTSLDAVPRAVAEPLVLMLAPIAPHVCEELWSRLGHADSLAYAPWPTHDPALLTSDTMDIVVQVMGKKRGLVHVPIDADQDAILSAAHREESVARHLEGKTIRKVIYVPGKLLNVVAN